jgi:hypothetical protein
MSIIWYTNLELDTGKVYDTRKWTYLNRQALEAAPREVQEVEDLLEEVRADQFPESPRRLDSILAIPWPEHPYSERRVRPERVFDPPGTGAYCYYLSLLPDTNHRTLDEKYVTELVRMWPEIGGSHERWAFAAEYWDGGILQSYSLLIEGIFTVEEPCAGGDVPFESQAERGYGRREGVIVLPRPGRQAQARRKIKDRDDD